MARVDELTDQGQLSEAAELQEIAADLANEAVHAHYEAKRDDPPLLRFEDAVPVRLVRHAA